tara:strand:- start:1202 stop:2089 length:888 start_codon:yes stop_codon:yes gene_type:complete
MKFYSHGKLLLTGEYTVLEGAKALALPTKKGQQLQVEPSPIEQLFWRSLAWDGSCWFEAQFELNDFKLIHSDAPEIANRLQMVLNAVREQNKDFCQRGTKITTQLEFDRGWGLGSSSTLLANIAQWAAVDSYQLLEATLGGSGYDVACAQAEQPILYQRVNGKPKVSIPSFDPPFKEDLFFVYLNHKQDSQQEVAAYKIKPTNTKVIDAISHLTEEIVSCRNLNTFMKYLNVHEDVMASHLGRIRVQEKYFSDFPGCVKSLGAWGGDFVLACGGPQEYFNQKGFSIIKSYSEFIV